MEAFSGEVFDSVTGDKVIAGEDEGEGGRSCGEANGRVEARVRSRGKVGDKFGERIGEKDSFWPSGVRDEAEYAGI